MKHEGLGKRKKRHSVFKKKLFKKKNGKNKSGE